MKLDPEQKEFINRVIKSNDRYQMLLGGAGTGKTTVVTRLMNHFATKNYKVISVYPTHKAKYVGIEKLQKYILELGGESLSLQEQESHMGSTEVDDSTVELPGGGLIDFRTIHSFIGLGMHCPDGQTKSVAYQDIAKYIKSKLNLQDLQEGYEAIVVFVDEISMIPLPFLTIEDRTKPHKIIEVGGLVQLLEDSKVSFRVVFTGDFNQLMPVNRPYREFSEDFATKYIPSHTLKVNHRSGAQAIVDTGEFCFAHQGRLPPPLTEDPAVLRTKDRKEFVSLYLDTLAKGKQAAALVWTNKARKRYENLASKEIFDQPDPIFVGNTVLSGTTKTLDIGEGRVSTLLYSQERVEIISKGPEEIIYSTAWAENPISVHPVTVKRLMDHSVLSFYGVMSVGDTISPEVAKYTNEIGSAWRGLGDFAKNNPSHDLEHLFNYAEQENQRLLHLFRDEEFHRLLTKGSRTRSYYNKNWADEDGRWNSSRACAHTAAYLWKRFGANVIDSILPIKTEVAQTCHMAQGSGIDYVFVDITDIRRVPNNRSQKGMTKREDFRRLMYVACSRAKKQLIILE